MTPDHQVCANWTKLMIHEFDGQVPRAGDLIFIDTLVHSSKTSWYQVDRVEWVYREAVSRMRAVVYIDPVQKD